MPKFYKVKRINSMIEAYRLPFGGHKGKLLQEVEDIEYLSWFSTVTSSAFQKKMIRIFINAWENHADSLPEYMDERQLTKWILAQREKNLARRREKQHDP